MSDAEVGDTASLPSRLVDDITGLPISRMSVGCFQVWARFDEAGLREWASRHKLVVRVPVERQRWPNRNMIHDE